MPQSTDSRVTEYIDGFQGWRRDICNQVRTLVHQADPEVTETIKRTNRPYFVLDGNVCALLVTKDHVNVFIYDPVAPDPEGIINQGQGNKTARAIQLWEGDALNGKAFTDVIKAVIANNRVGGWRKLGSR